MKTVIDVVSYLLNKFEQMEKREKHKMLEMLKDKKYTAAEMVEQKTKTLAFGEAKAVIINYCKNGLGISENAIFSMIRGKK